jgi:uncharacterized protein DUF975
MNYQFNKFDIIETVNESWEIFKKHLGMVLLGWVLAMVANIAIAMGIWMIHTFVDVAIAICLGLPIASIFDGAKSGAGGTAAGIGLLVCKLSTQIIFQIIQTVLSMFVVAGLLSYFIKFARKGEPPDLKTLLIYDKRILNMFLFQLLLTLIIFTIFFIALAPGGIALAIAVSAKVSYIPAIVLGCLGIIILIIATIYIQLVTSQSFYLIVDKRIGPIDALILSNQAMKGNRLNLFYLGLLMSAVGIVIAICTCGIGLIFLTPFSLLIMAKIYIAIVDEEFTPELPKNEEEPEEVCQYNSEDTFYR